MKLSFWKILKIALQGKTTKMFFVLTVLSLSFSMGVILCNLGLMDGYEVLVKEGLRKNTSDLEISSSSGFFEINNEFTELINKSEIKEYAGVIKTQGFIVNNEKSKGVLLYGIVPEEYSKVSRLSIPLKGKDTIVLGSELAKELKVGIGESVTITFTRGNKSFEDLPYVAEIEVAGIVTHGVYRKDSRVAYLPRGYIEEFTNSKGMLNSVLVKLDNFSDKEIESYVSRVEESFWEKGFEVRPYWRDFATLFEAVEVEKFSITVILQLIILIALFNIVAFINFNAIKKSQDFFLLRSLGLSFKSLYTFWTLFILLIWFISCIFSLVFAFFFDKVVLKLPAFSVPGKVYELDHLSISLDLKSVLIVFALTFFWSLISIFYIISREKKKTILQGIKGQYT